MRGSYRFKMFSLFARGVFGFSFTGSLAMISLAALPFKGWLVSQRGVPMVSPP
jgi:hypothetical protein